MTAAAAVYVVAVLALLAGAPLIVTAVTRRLRLARQPVTVPPPFCDPTGQPWPDDHAARLLAAWRAEAPETP